MSDPRIVYLLDTDVLITAKNLYYGFDICPGFWATILAQHKLDVVFSVSRVQGELMNASPDDVLLQWVTNDVPASFFIHESTELIVREFQGINLWVLRHNRFSDAAKSKFASSADGWLIACARAIGATVVTNETPRPDSRNTIKIPDVCEEFGVPWVNTFQMLRNVNARFDISPNSLD